MKVLFLSLLLCFGAFASEGSLFVDEEIDLVIRVPDELKRTWNVSNCQSGLSLTVFNTDDEDGDDYILMVGKIPLVNLPGDDLVDVLPMLLEELYNNFTAQECSYLLDEVQCYVEKLIPLSSEFSNRFRINLFLHEIDEVIRMDLHLFVKNGQSCAILTAALDCRASDDLDDFSEYMIENTYFIQ